KRPHAWVSPSVVSSGSDVSRHITPSQPEQRLQVLPQDLLLLVLCNGLQALHPAAGARRPRHERPVAAEYHAVCAYMIEQEAQLLLPRDHGVVVETALVVARRLGRAAGLRAAVPVAVEATDGVAGGAAPMGDADADIRARFQHA